METIIIDVKRSVIYGVKNGVEFWKFKFFLYFCFVCSVGILLDRTL